MRTEKKEQNTSKLHGVLRLVKPYLQGRHGHRVIAIQYENEKMPADFKGTPPLRYINLIGSASTDSIFALGVTIFLDQRITVTVITDDLEKDLLMGEGLKGKPRLIGVHFE